MEVNNGHSSHKQGARRFHLPKSRCHSLEPTALWLQSLPSGIPHLWGLMERQKLELSFVRLEMNLVGQQLRENLFLLWLARRSLLLQREQLAQDKLSNMVQGAELHLLLHFVPATTSEVSREVSRRCDDDVNELEQMDSATYILSQAPHLL